MIHWRDLKIVGPGGDEVTDEGVRAAALAATFEVGTVSVLDPAGEPVGPEDVNWEGIEALAIEPINGRDGDTNQWLRPGIPTEPIRCESYRNAEEAAEPQEVEA